MLSASTAVVIRRSDPRIELCEGKAPQPTTTRVGGFYQSVAAAVCAAELLAFDVAILHSAQVGYWLCPLALLHAHNQPPGAVA